MQCMFLFRNQRISFPHFLGVKSSKYRFVISHINHWSFCRMTCSLILSILHEEMLYHSKVNFYLQVCITFWTATMTSTLSSALTSYLVAMAIDSILGTPHTWGWFLPPWIGVWQTEHRFVDNQPVVRLERRWQKWRFRARRLETVQGVLTYKWKITAVTPSWRCIWYWKQEVF